MKLNRHVSCGYTFFAVKQFMALKCMSKHSFSMVKVQTGLYWIFVCSVCVCCYFSVCLVTVISSLMVDIIFLRISGEIVRRYFSQFCEADDLLIVTFNLKIFFTWKKLNLLPTSDWCVKLEQNSIQLNVLVWKWLKKTKTNNKNKVNH